MVGTITVSNSTATYAWNTGETTASINVTPTTNTTYTVTATDGNCVATDDVDVTVTPNPTVNLGNDVAICQGDSTLLDAGSGHTNYLWNTGETTQTIYADTAGTYSVTVGNGTPITNNNSLSFDGMNDEIIIPHDNILSINNYSNFTISCWAKFDNNTDQQWLINKSNGLGNQDKWALVYNWNYQGIVFHTNRNNLMVSFLWFWKAVI